MTNLTPRPKATGHEVSEDLGRGRGRGKVRPLLFPGPWLRVEIIRGPTTPSPAGPRPLAHPPHRDLSVPDSGPGARQQQPREEVRRGGCSPPSWAPPRAGIPQPQRRGARARSRARGCRQQSWLCDGEDSLWPEIPQSLLGRGALLTVRAARNPEPGGDPGSCARPRSRYKSGSSASSPHRARASPLGGWASPRRGAPLARAARPRPQTAPRPDGPAPVAPPPLPGSAHRSAPSRESCF